MKIIANKFHMKVNLIYAAFVAICMAGTLLIFSGNEGFRDYIIATLTTIACFICVYSLSRVFAPAKLDKENDEIVKCLQKELDEIKKPRLKIEYKENNPNYFTQSMGVQLHRISIRNLSSIETIENVKVRFTEMQPLHGVVKNNLLPVLLHFTGDHKEHYDLSRDIDPDVLIFIDVIELHTVSSGNSYYKITTSETSKSTEFNVNSEESFEITIQASGLNAKVEENKFKFGITTNDVGGDWKLWFKPMD